MLFQKNAQHFISPALQKHCLSIYDRTYSLPAAASQATLRTVHKISCTGVNPRRPTGSCPVLKHQ